jgi:hypothetical protein
MPLPPRTDKLWEPLFLQQYHMVLTAIAQVISEGRRYLPNLTDVDVQATLDSLLQTFHTLDKGIYYDFSPVSANPKTLYAALKSFLEGPTDDKLVSTGRLTTTEIVDCLQFLKELSSIIVLPRPKSRAFLDHLESVAGSFSKASHDEPKLILPAEF